MTTALVRATELNRLLQTTEVRGRFEDILRSKAPGFISSIVNTVNSTPALVEVANKNPFSIIRAAAVAATMDLPIDRNLGFAWIVPYGGEAQFQMGYRGYIQLALRTSQYKKLNALEVYQNQFKSWDPLTETLEADFTIEGTGDVVGIAVYYELTNGFSKVAYFPKQKLLAHGKKYSKSFHKKDGAWQTHPIEMCKKTAIAKVLKTWGILSIEMQRAIKADQAVVRSDDLDDAGAFDYIDGKTITVEAETRSGKTKLDEDLKAAVNDPEIDQAVQELKLGEDHAGK